MKRCRKFFIVFFVSILLATSVQIEGFAATATVDTIDVHQTIEDFGASLACWYSGLIYHPYRKQLVEMFDSLSESETRILICSWSPPAALKSNNKNEVRLS